MNKHILITVIAFMSISISCQNQMEKGRDKTEINKEVSDDNHHTASATGVMLDNGKKWIANPETSAGIDAMIRLVQDFKDEQDMGKLKENLESEFQMIFQKCTMKGMAHERLHNYLLPLKDKLKALNDPPSSEKIKAINAYLNDYRNYFE